MGHEVFEAATGPEVIDRASSIHPDLIMMDLILPGMNGDEATARGVYQVAEEGGDHFLHARAEKQDVQIGLSHVFAVSRLIPEPSR